MTRSSISIAMAAFALIAAAVGLGQGADRAKGKELVEAKCTKCHGADAYAGTTRKITSIGELGKQVEACAKGAQTGWSAEQIADVVQYLNEDYYRFK